jgi:hypothetical protein
MKHREVLSKESIKGQLYEKKQRTAIRNSVASIKGGLASL